MIKVSDDELQRVISRLIEAERELATKGDHGIAHQITGARKALQSLIANAPDSPS
jgi:hypothetical protein